jgi:hypothetical protein
VTDVRPLQSLKRESDNVDTPNGILMLVRLLQCAKAIDPNDLTELGMLMLVSSEQSKNASSPILVNSESLGMVQDVSLLSYLKVYPLILVTPLGILIDLILAQ